MKKRRKQKFLQRKVFKGFTMVELLVTIAILGLLTIMAFPTLRGLIAIQNKKIYDSYGSSIISAAKLYVDSYENDVFNNNEVDSNTIQFDDLYKKNLIKDINMSGSTCYNPNTYVIVARNNDGYLYCLNMMCTSKDDSSNILFEMTDKKDACSGFKMYAVTYYGNGSNTGTMNMTKELANTEISIKSNEFGRTHYSFSNWNTSKDGTGKKYNPGDKIVLEKNINLFAQWSPNNYTLTYNSNGGSACNPNLLTKAYGSKWGSLCSTSKVGYTFNGWYSSDSLITSDSIVSGNISVIAKWKINKYKMSFDKNGGTGTCSTITKDYNTKWGSLCSVSKSGYVFDGWFTSSGTQITENSVATSDLTVKAKYTQQITCSAGTYLGSNATSCSNCESGYYCKGGTFPVKNTIQGRNDCPNGYGNSAVKSSKDTECYMNVAANKYIKNSKDSIATSCDSGTKSDAHIVYYTKTSSCKSVGVICSAGYYLKGGKSSCSKCEAGYYCPGGTYEKKSSDQGRSSCPNGYGKSSSGSSKNTDCYKEVSAGKHVGTAKGSATACAKNSYKGAHNVHYGKTSSCTKCSSGYYTVGTGSDSSSDCIKSYNCKVRGAVLKNVSAWTCSRGHRHTTAYIHYCMDGSGKLVTKSQSSINTYSYICPTNPYQKSDGWKIIQGK